MDDRQITLISYLETDLQIKEDVVYVDRNR